MARNFNKAERYVKQDEEYKLLSYATSSESVEMDDGRDLQTKVKEINKSISDEITRASNAEKVLTDKLAKEVTDRTNAVSAEKIARENADTVLTNNLDSEISRAKSAEKTNADALTAETTRATTKENEIYSNLSSEVTRAENAECNLDSKKVDKTTVATSSALGLVKSGTDITVDTSGNVSVNDNSHKHTVSNISDLTATASELNVLDGITATTAELNYTDGVTSNIQTQLNSKVDKVSGKGLSTNDYTTAEKNKLAGIASGAEVNVQSDWSITDTSSDAYIKNKPSVYTKNEVDNKFSSLETNIDWKESVATYNDIATTYPSPQDGWTVNVKDTDYTYRYNGTSWVAISANAIPKATNSVDGLLSKEDHTNYEDANSKKHVHGNKSIIDTITQALLDKWNAAYTHISDAVKHITSAERTLWNTVSDKVDKVSGKSLSTNDLTSILKSNYDNAYSHSQSAHAPSNAQVNIIETVKVNGTALTPSSKAVNVTVPTKVSQLTNDSGYKTTDTNTWRPLGTTADTACAGNDSRLSNARPASDVYSWAKASTKPSYSYSEISGTPSSLPANGGTATASSYSNQLQAFTGDNFTGGDHFVKAIRDSSGWSTRLWMCYNGGTKQSDAVSVNYANSAGYATSAGSAPASDVYAWAKASTKPSYTASEVGAAPASHTHSYLPLSGGTLTGGLTSNSSITSNSEGNMVAMAHATVNSNPGFVFHYGTESNVSYLYYTGAGNLSRLIYECSNMSNFFIVKTSYASVALQTQYSGNFGVGQIYFNILHGSKTVNGLLDFYYDMNLDEYKFRLSRTLEVPRIITTSGVDLDTIGNSIEKNFNATILKGDSNEYVIAQLILPKGHVYLVTGTSTFGSTKGYVKIELLTNNSTSMSRWCTSAAASDTSGQLAISNTKVIDCTSSEVTVYLKAKQNSNSQYNVYPGIRYTILR